MNIPKMSIAIMLAAFLPACAGTQAGGGEAAPVSGNQIKLTVVNESDGPVDVYYLWEDRTTRARLGTVAIGRSADFGVPWVTGRLRILFESPVATTSITSNVLQLSDANRPDELLVLLDWRYRAVLEIKK